MAVVCSAHSYFKVVNTMISHGPCAETISPTTTAAKETTRIMNTKSLAIASVLAASLATAAHAQTLTVTGSVTGSKNAFTYTYAVTPNFNVNQLFFNFADPNVTFSSDSGPLSLTSSSTVPSAGVFSFDSGQLNAGSTETFSFLSPDAPGGSVGEVGISYSGSGVAALNGTMPAPAAAPEPSGMVALTVLFGCLTFGVAAKRRKATAVAL